MLVALCLSDLHRLGSILEGDGYARTPPPTYVFALGVWSTFKTSDGMVSHVGGKKPAVVHSSEAPFDVSEYHFREATGTLPSWRGRLERGRSWETKT